jgi:hypothetical protein
MPTPIPASVAKFLDIEAKGPAKAKDSKESKEPKKEQITASQKKTELKAFMTADREARYTAISIAPARLFWPASGDPPFETRTVKISLPDL